MGADPFQTKNTLLPQTLPASIASMYLRLANIPIIPGLTTIPFDTVLYDALGEIDLANEWWTPKNDGYYLFIGQVFLIASVANDQERIELTDSGGTLLAWSAQVTSTQAPRWMTLLASTISFMPAGAHVFVRVQVAHNATIQLGRQYTYFAVRQVA